MHNMCINLGLNLASQRSHGCSFCWVFTALRRRNNLKWWLQTCFGFIFIWEIITTSSLTNIFATARLYRLLLCSLTSGLISTFACTMFCCWQRLARESYPLNYYGKRFRTCAGFDVLQYPCFWANYSEVLNRPLVTPNDGLVREASPSPPRILHCLNWAAKNTLVV